MKFICLLACLFAAFRFTPATEPPQKIEHIFTHELVYDTEKAYAQNNSLRNCFDKDHLTSREFGALLGELYDNGYALVSIKDAVKGVAPKDKRGVTLSFDDMTYDTTGKGSVDKLVIKDGEVCDYTRSAEPAITRERECIPILERFIELHPDFSYNGARATICVNGYNGILGYRITPDCKVSDEFMQKERTECAALVEKLKSLGYDFASHTYYHKYFNSMSEKEIQADIDRWKTYVEPVVGKTDILCYPAGEHNAKSQKNELFVKNGFSVFLCVGSGPTEFEKKQTDRTYVYRKPFDGTALRLYQKQYAHLADTKKIYDETRFRPFSYRGGYY